MIKKRARLLAMSPCYVTMGRDVYLGRCTPRTRKNALAAGLRPVTAKTMYKWMRGTQAIQRIMLLGEWHDTVKY
jgi:hypothetical protein